MTATTKDLFSVSGRVGHWYKELRTQFAIVETKERLFYQSKPEVLMLCNILRYIIKDIVNTIIEEMS